MPTYLILFIGRLLAIGNLEFRNLRLLLAGRPFILRGEFGADYAKFRVMWSEVGERAAGAGFIQFYSA